MMHDWNSLPGSRDPTTLFPQLEQLLFSTSDTLHTRQHVYGAGIWCASLKRIVLLNGDGNKKETAGASYGLHSHQLLRVASNWRNASARRSVADGASVTSSVWAARPCAAAPAKNSVYTDNSKLHDFTCTHAHAHVYQTLLCLLFALFHCKKRC